MALQSAFGCIVLRPSPRWSVLSRSNSYRLKSISCQAWFHRKECRMLFGDVHRSRLLSHPVIWSLSAFPGEFVLALCHLGISLKPATCREPSHWVCSCLLFHALNSLKPGLRVSKEMKQRLKDSRFLGLIPCGNPFLCPRSSLWSHGGPNFNLAASYSNWCGLAVYKRRPSKYVIG